MMGNKKNLLVALCGERPERVPIWLMRQAGRYLPEYQALRKQAGSFMSLCLTPELAAEVTLQPVKRFGMDGAILFSDILMVPYGLGYALEFIEGKGPVLEKFFGTMPVFETEKFYSRTSPIYETVKRIKQEKPEKAGLIGFCGGAWTVACYMLGNSADQFLYARDFSLSADRIFRQLLDVLVEASGFYLIEQIKAGAEAIQIFDSHAGLAPPGMYEDYVVAPTRALVRKIHAVFPHIPVIGFPRQSLVENLAHYTRETKVTALSLDTSAGLAWAQENIHAVLQGNLDPKLMEGEAAPMLEAAATILKTMKKPFVFNL
ncbi:MAG: uroporphyrinogen decarboxylase, partial [Proteobacteria bacterium]|nr:uroporphyrinogen decarboxylase [Pseudomonadota bacterium]